MSGLVHSRRNDHGTEKRESEALCQAFVMYFPLIQDRAKPPLPEGCRLKRRPLGTRARFPLDEVHTTHTGETSTAAEILNPKGCQLK